MRIFFATDLHGSNICFKKFCAALEFYEVDALVLGSDLSGKLLIPIVATSRDFHYELGGVEVNLPLDALESERRRIADMGYYTFVGSEDEVTELNDPAVYEKILLEETRERLGEWIEYADRQLAHVQWPIPVALGNDDDWSLDDLFDGSQVFELAESRVVPFGEFEVVATGWTNPTPWNTPRECSEAELDMKLRSIASTLEDPARSIFLFHVPPINSTLDVCPELKSDLSVRKIMGSPVMTHAGSSAVRELITDLQPLLSLHGHIHESRSAELLGRTLCINPGSEYSEGVLRGAVITIDGSECTYHFTAG